MSSGYVDPNATPESSAAWIGVPRTGPLKFENIDDGTRQPTAPDTSDYIRGGANGQVDAYDMTRFSVSSVTQVKVWAYCKRDGWGPGPFELHAAIYMGAGWSAYSNLAPTTTASWKSVTFTGSWSQGDLDDLRVRLKMVTSDDQPEKFQVYALYCEITYT